MNRLNSALQRNRCKAGWITFVGKDKSYYMTVALVLIQMHILVKRRK